MKGEEFMEPLDLKKGKTLGGAFITYFVYLFLGVFILSLIWLILAFVLIPFNLDLTLIEDIIIKIFTLTYTSILLYLATTEFKNRMMKMIFFVINAICAISLPIFVAMLIPAIATFCNPKKIIKYQTSKSSLGPKETT